MGHQRWIINYFRLIEEISVTVMRWSNDGLVPLIIALLLRHFGLLHDATIERLLCHIAFCRRYCHSGTLLLVILISTLFVNHSQLLFKFVCLFIYAGLCISVFFFRPLTCVHANWIRPPSIAFWLLSRELYTVESAACSHFYRTNLFELNLKNKTMHFSNSTVICAKLKIQLNISNLHQ